MGTQAGNEEAYASHSSYNAEAWGTYNENGDYHRFELEILLYLESRIMSPKHYKL